MVRMLLAEHLPEGHHSKPAKKGPHRRQGAGFRKRRLCLHCTLLQHLIWAPPATAGRHDVTRSDSAYTGQVDAGHHRVGFRRRHPDTSLDKGKPAPEWVVVRAEWCMR